jgi:hypothetical protein
VKLARSIVVALLAGCSARPATIIRVELAYPGSWGLTGIEVRSGERDVRAGIAAVVRIIVPDDWADRTTDLDVWGLRGEQRYAFAHVQTSPIRGDEVTVQAELALTPCSDCGAGADGGVAGAVDAGVAGGADAGGGDPCDGVTCTSPPAAMCLDADTLRAYGAGSCAGGACSYPPTDTPCAGGCQGGACASPGCDGCTGNTYCAGDTCATAAFLGPYDQDNICPPGFDFVEICPSGGGMVCVASGVGSDYDIAYDYDPLGCPSGMHRALTWPCGQLTGTLCVAD